MAPTAIERPCQERHGRRRHRDAIHARRSRRVGARRRAEARHQHGRGLTRRLLAAKSIGYSQRLQRQHAAEGIAQLGLTEQLKPKLTVTGGGTGPVTFFLARGDFELGIQQTNIMVGAPGTDFVGPVPAGVDKPCPNSVGLLTVSKEQDAARAMIKFMTSPEAVPLLRKVHEMPAKS